MWEVQLSTTILLFCVRRDVPPLCSSNTYTVRSNPMKITFVIGWTPKSTIKPALLLESDVK